jgi:hypothetical protein
MQTAIRFNGRKWCRDLFVLAAAVTLFGLPVLGAALAVAGVLVGQLGE